MPYFRLLPLLVVLLLASCQSTRLAEGEGEGLVTWDRVPPDGAQTYERPEWTVGDRFIYSKAGDLRLAFRVEERSEGGYRLIEEESGLITWLTVDLGERGQEQPGVPEATRVVDPMDAVLSWPLWKGKRWACHFLSKFPGQPALPLMATYQCDAIETITVPAGTFQCLRIWRRARVAAQGDYVERVSLLYYAPEVGYFARRLDDSLLLDLQEYHRQ